MTMPPQTPYVPPEEAQQAAAQQVQQVTADLGGAEPAAELSGGQMLGAGAHPGEVDAAALLAEIRALQGRVDAMEAEKRQELAPAIVVYAQALADHVNAKIAANPVTAADADLPGSAGADLAAAALEAAKAAVESGNITGLASKVQDVTGWVRAHAAKFPHIDWSYVLKLAEEIGGAAAKLAA